MAKNRNRRSPAPATPPQAQPAPTTSPESAPPAGATTEPEAAEFELDQAEAVTEPAPPPNPEPEDPEPGAPEPVVTHIHFHTTVPSTPAQADELVRAIDAGEAGLLEPALTPPNRNVSTTALGTYLWGGMPYFAGDVVVMPRAEAERRAARGQLKIDD